VEYQAKIDPDLLAIEAYRLGRIYNNALVVPEMTGGWGFTIASELKKLGYPKLYTRRIKDRLTQKWTDKLGWDTNLATRALMLDTLEQALRERSLELHGERTLAELVTFVRDEKGRPAAQPGTNDDLVVTLAMGVTVALELPRLIRRIREREYVPQFAATGY
jgi:phage terminase large subunit